MAVKARKLSWLWLKTRENLLQLFQSISKTYIAGISESKMECLIGMQFDDFVMVAADQTNAR